jgi:V/A-type H+-transporting ATPase subunit E
MSCKELIESLRKAADERVRVLWQEAERHAEDAKAELARKAAGLQEESDRSRMGGGTGPASTALAEANNKARMLRLAGEHELCQRLLKTASAALPLLRDGQYEKTFARMAGELPALEWTSVNVNPLDSVLARKHFPGANIISDEAITGGLDVSTAEGAIRIVNTLEKRLERAWNDMLSDLVKEVRRDLSDGTS